MKKSQQWHTNKESPQLWHLSMAALFHTPLPSHFWCGQAEAWDYRPGSAHPTHSWFSHLDEVLSGKDLLSLGEFSYKPQNLVAHTVWLQFLSQFRAIQTCHLLTSLFCGRNPVPIAKPLTLIEIVLAINDALLSSLPVPPSRLEAGTSEHHWQPEGSKK